MADVILAKTSIWGSTVKCKQEDFNKLQFKESIRGLYPVIDHDSIWSLKPRNQRGPAREEQTLLLSFAYNYDNYYDDATFINDVREHGLGLYKEPCMFRGKNAYKIIIYDTAVELDVALPLINGLPMV